MKNATKERTCRMTMHAPHFGYVVKCSICHTLHTTKLYKRCPGCGRLVEDHPKDKAARKEFDQARREFFLDFQSMMRATTADMTFSGGSGRRERRTIDAGRR